MMGLCMVDWMIASMLSHVLLEEIGQRRSGKQPEGDDASATGASNSAPEREKQSRQPCVAFSSVLAKACDVAERGDVGVSGRVPRAVLA
jgi:hypothetical protein